MANTPATSSDTNDLDILDCVQVTPEHIRANGTLHSTPYAGLAELIDNALDSEAANVQINYCIRPRDDPMSNYCGNYITVLDNGAGMSRTDALNTILIGYSIKRGSVESIGQFGNGLKSGSMRLGDTLLLCTRRFHQFTALLISLKYLDTICTQKCYVPCISYERNTETEVFERMGMLNECKEKHERALEIILKYSPFCTEEALLTHMRTIENSTGTCILVTHLKQLENGEYELGLTKGDLVVNMMQDEDQAPVGKRSKKKVADDEEEGLKKDVYFSEYLSQLYLEPKVSITINERKVNVRDPKRCLAEPRWAYLARGGIEQFKKREKEVLDVESDKMFALCREKEAKERKLHADMSRIEADKDKEGTAEIYFAMRRDIRMVQQQITDYKKKFKEIVNRKQSLKPGSEVQVYFGIDLQRRCDPRIVFYTNKRRILTVPLNKKGLRFRKIMGVVCLVDLPSTLLATAQNRENYANPNELAIIVSKVTKLAENYFEYADPKYKSDQFWTQLGYDPNAVPSDIADHKALAAIIRLTGLRRLCANCREFREVYPRDLEKQTDSLDVLNNPFVCSSVEVIHAGEVVDLDAKICVPKTNQELDEERIRELRITGKATYYSPEKPLTSDPQLKKAVDKPVDKPAERPLPPKRPIPAASSAGPSRRAPPPESSDSESSVSPPPSPKRRRQVAKPSTASTSSKSTSSKASSSRANLRMSINSNGKATGPAKKTPPSKPIQRKSDESSTSRTRRVPSLSSSSDENEDLRHLREPSEESEESEDQIIPDAADDSDREDSASPVERNGNNRQQAQQPPVLRTAKPEEEDGPNPFAEYRRRTMGVTRAQLEEIEDGRRKEHARDLEGRSKEQLLNLLVEYKCEEETGNEVLFALSRVLASATGTATGELEQLIKDLSSLTTSEEPMKRVAAIVNRRR